MTANGYKLMYCRKPTNAGVVLNIYMPCYLHSIRNNNIVSNTYVMSEVHISHNHAIATYYRFVSVYCTTVNGNTFTNGGILTNAHNRFFSIKFKILWNSRYHC